MGLNFLCLVLALIQMIQTLIAYIVRNQMIIIQLDQNTHTCRRL